MWHVWPSTCKPLFCFAMCQHANSQERKKGWGRACLVVTGECQQGCTHTPSHTSLLISCDNGPCLVGCVYSSFFSFPFVSFRFQTHTHTPSSFTSSTTHHCLINLLLDTQDQERKGNKKHTAAGLNAEHNTKQPRGQGHRQTVPVLARHQDHHRDSGKTLYRLPRPIPVDLLWHPWRRCLDPDQQHFLPSYRRPPGTVTSIAIQGYDHTTVSSRETEWIRLTKSGYPNFSST